MGSLARTIALALAPCLALAPLVRGSGPPAASPDRAKEAALLRDYALAACLVDRYKGEPLAEEAGTWAGGLIEHGSVPIETYGDLNAFVRENAPAPQAAKRGPRMRLASCMTLYRGPALAAEIDRLLRR